MRIATKRSRRTSSRTSRSFSGRFSPSELSGGGFEPPPFNSIQNPGCPMSSQANSILSALAGLSPAGQRALYDAVLHRSLPHFIERAFTTVSPGDAFTGNWHLDAISHALTRVAKGECRRLIITVPRPWPRPDPASHLHQLLGGPRPQARERHPGRALGALVPARVPGLSHRYAQ